MMHTRRENHGPVSVRNRSTQGNGFTLLEMLIVVAIVAILVAIAIPIFNTQLESTRKATCLANRTSLYHVMAADVASGTYDSMEDAFNALYTNDNETKYVCPSGGTYTYSPIDGTITCSVAGHNDERSSEDNLNTMYAILIGNNNVNSWLTSAIKQKSRVINSATADLSPTSHAADYDKLLKAAGLDTDSHSYLVSIKKGTTLTSPTAGSYNIYLANKKLTDDDVGTTVSVTRYDVGAGTYTAGTMSVVKQDDGAGNIIVRLVESSFTAS